MFLYFLLVASLQFSGNERLLIGGKVQDGSMLGGMGRAAFKKSIGCRNWSASFDFISPSEMAFVLSRYLRLLGRAMDVVATL